MKVSHGNHTCEHCAAKVATAKLCPCCGQEHSADWLANATKADNMTAWTIVFVIPYFVSTLIEIHPLPFDQWFNAFGSMFFDMFLIAVGVCTVYGMLFGLKAKPKDIDKMKVRFNL